MLYFSNKNCFIIKNRYTRTYIYLSILKRMNESYIRKLIQVLGDLGLNKGESQTFVAGLQIGATSIQQLSKIT